MKTLNTYFLLVLSIAMTVGCNSSGNGEHSAAISGIAPQGYIVGKGALLVPVNDQSFANTTCSTDYGSLSESDKDRCHTVISDLCKDMDARSDDIEAIPHWRPVGAASEYLKSIRSTAKKKNHFTCSLYSFLHEAQSAIVAERGFMLKALQRRDLGQGTFQDDVLIKNLISKYDVKNNSKVDLISKVDVLPFAFVLAIGAHESAWGTSRIAKVGTNIFGRWSSKGCQVGVTCITALRNKSVFPKKFASLEDSVHDQILYLNRHRAYPRVRQIRDDYRLNGVGLEAIAFSGALPGYSADAAKYQRVLRNKISSSTNWQKYDVFDTYVAPNGIGLGI